MPGADRSRILLLGATGALGRHLAEALRDDFAVCAPAPRGAAVSLAPQIHVLSRALEATWEESIGPLVAEAAPDVMINCVAVKPGAADAATMVEVNGVFPHRLARLAQVQRCRLVHISTDGVFSGRRGRYSERDLPDPLDLYGRSKLAGEVTDAGCLTLRTSFYGRSPRGEGLVEWLLAQGGGKVAGYRNYVFSGLALPALAGIVAALLRRSEPLAGLYHVGGPAISKYDLLVALAAQLRLPVDIEPVDEPRMDRSLDCGHFRAATGIEPPPLADMIRSVVREGC